MNWILIGIVAGSLIVSGHETEEACKGREAMLSKQKIAAKCVQAPLAPGTILWSGGSGNLCCNGNIPNVCQAC
jgi:hypothetical protein